MVCSKNPENINIKTDDDELKQVPKFKYLGGIFTEDGTNKGDIIQRIKEAKVLFNNKKQLLCSNNLSLEIKKNLTKNCIWSVAACGSETWTVGENEGRVVNGFETWCWGGMLKIKWTDRIPDDEALKRAKEEILLLKILKNRSHSRTTVLKASRHNTAADSYTAMSTMA
jgi:hypothetical protein